MADNPSPSYITDEMWWLWERLHELEPSTKLGGIYAAKSGYHNTGQANLDHWPGNYSVRDIQDRRGAHWRDKASALDWTFPDAQAGHYATIAKYHGRFMAAARARDPRLAGWREAYGQADMDTAVEGWDIRKHQAVTSDRSHLWHIHFSEVREFVNSLINKQALLSVLAGEILADYLARGGKLITATPTPAPPTAYPKWPGRNLRYVKGKAQMHGTDVLTWQKRMKARGWRIDADGWYGPQSAAICLAFQREKHLTRDGIVGPKTWAAAWTAPITKS
jgi:hypothetical protein